MSAVTQIKTLWHLAAARVRGNSHQERLESFYAGQAEGYDSFREKLLHGRQELIASLPVKEGDVWVDFGAGTGSNAEYLRRQIGAFRSIYQIDLCPSLLKVARNRAAERGWNNVRPTHADATQFVAPEPADLVTFSYSLTMIPDWFSALQRAYESLKPGGMVGIVDFYVARKYPPQGQVKHNWSTRTFWSTWFAFDNVFLSPDHLPYLKGLFEPVFVSERRGKVPYLPWVRAPYYLFIGRKPSHQSRG